MKRLYEGHLIHKLEPAAALREAILWLRQSDDVPGSSYEMEGTGFCTRASDEMTIFPSLQGLPTTTRRELALARMPIIWASYTYHGV